MDLEVPPTRYATTWGYRFPGVIWWVALVIIPILFAALGSAMNRGSIEADLTSRSVTALQEAGIENIHVRFEVRDASLDVLHGVNVAEDELARAKRIVAAIDGVRIVTAANNNPQGAAADAADATEAKR
jgi:hypothetical protein